MNIGLGLALTNMLKAGPPPDTTAPTVTITSSETSPSAAATIPLTITFSEVVTGFAVGDITVVGCTLGALSGSGAVYTVTATPTAAAITVNIAAGVCVDAAGNSNTAATQFSITSLASFYMIADFSTNSYLYQDAAKTTPVTANNDPIGGVADIKATYDLTNPGGTVRPTYKTNQQNGLSAAFFDGGDYLVNTSLAANRRDLSLYFVLKPTNTQSLEVILDMGSGFRIQTNLGQFLIASSNPSSTTPRPTQAASNAWHIVGVDYTSTHVIISVDGLLAGGCPIDAGTNTSWTYGALGASFYYNGYIGQLLAGTYLARISRDSVVSALASKWGITLSTVAGNIVCDGDSTTYGTNVTQVQTDPYPQQLATAYRPTLYHVYNFGTPSRTAAVLVTDLTRFEPLLQSGMNNVYVLLIGTNDLKNGTSAATIYGYITTAITTLQGYGYKVIVCTVLPRADAGLPGDYATQFANLNTSINTNTAGAEYVVDLAADASLSDPNNATYYNTDKVHPKTAGATVMKNLIKVATDLAFA